MNKTKEQIADELARTVSLYEQSLIQAGGGESASLYLLDAAFIHARQYLKLKEGK